MVVRGLVRFDHASANRSVSSARMHRARSVLTWRCEGASARAIQELAGHQDLGTAQRYMHLSPAALDAAIRLLESDAAAASRGAQGGGMEGPKAHIH